MKSDDEMTDEEFAAAVEEFQRGPQDEIQRLRALLAEWEEGVYDGRDFLRRVRLALHGALTTKGD